MTRLRISRPANSPWIASRALEHTHREEQVAVLVIDVDRFKFVNSGLGHDIGDRILLAVVERIRSAIRPSDTLARFGGDEFVVVCEDLDAGYQAVGVAEAINRAMHVPFETGSEDVVLSVSIGIAFSRGSADSPKDLLRDANAAMNSAKDRGRARYEVFEDDLGARVTDRLKIEADLRTTLEVGGLTVYYQPKIDVASGATVGAEALVRWEHPQRGWVPPLDFVSIAEESGLIVPLGDLVLDHATKQLARWRSQGMDLHVAVNLSGTQILKPGLLDRFEAILSTNGVEASGVWLELTEAVLLDRESPVDLTLEGLRAMGFTLSLDDFGTGYSSLAYLQRYPFGELKIDRSFVGDLGADTDGGTLIEAIIDMAAALRLRVVAEGVEERAQYERLQELECDLAQGYFFERPLPADDFARFLMSGTRQV